jgi:hypothetical protein
MRKQWRETLRGRRSEEPAPLPLGDPQHWRARAEAARAKVDRGGAGRSTHRLARLAETYDRLAERLDRRQRLSSGD